MIKEEGYGRSHREIGSRSERCSPGFSSQRLGLVLSGPEVTYGEGDDESIHVSHFERGRLPTWSSEPEGGPLIVATKQAPVLLISGALERACLCARVAADNKGKDVVVLDMRKVTPLFDFFVLSTGASRRQIHTISEETDAALNGQGDRRVGIEGYESSKWVVQDYGDVMVHVFDPATRDYFQIEELYADAPRVDWERYA